MALLMALRKRRPHGDGLHVGQPYISIRPRPWSAGGIEQRSPTVRPSEQDGPG